MVSGVSAYQQQAYLAQSVSSSSNRSAEPRVDQRKADDSSARSDTTVSSRDVTRPSSVQSSARADEVSQDEQRNRAKDSSSQIGLGGKDAAQKRGSLLDTYA